MAWNSGLQIRVLDGSDRGKVFSLDAQEMTLGRALDPNEDAPGWVLFSEPTVSRVHAILQWKEAQRGYLLQHRSRTNPTLVDGKSVDQHMLQPGQKVQLGLLVFGVEAVEIRTGRLGDAVQTPPQRQPSLKRPVLEALNDLAGEKSREPMEGLAGLADEAPARGRRQARSTPGGLQLVTAQGPDQGCRFPLRETLLVLGRRLGPDDPRQSAGVLLNDESLPSEQALLVWHDREYTYGILQNEGSPVPTRLRRVLSGRPKEMVIGSDLPTPLYEGDVIMVGQSSLVVRKVEPSLEEDDEESQEDKPRFGASPGPNWPESREQRRGLGEMDAGVSKKPTGSRSSLRTWRNKPGDEAPDSDLSGDSPRLGSIDDSQDPGPLRPRRMPGAPLEATPSKPLKPQSRPRSIRTAPGSPPAAPRKEPPTSPPPPQEPPLEMPAPPVRPEPEPPAPPARRRARPTPPVVDAPEEPLAMPPPPPRAPVQEAEEPLAMPPPPPRAPVQEAEEPLAMPPPQLPVQLEVPPAPTDLEEPEEAPELVDLTPAAQPVAPVETPEEMPAVGGIVPRGLPPHLERSLRGGRTTPGTPSTPAAEMPDVPLFDPESFGSSTSAWRHHSDFVVGYLEGSRKGQKVDLLGSEFSEDRVVTIGSPGQRFNDIEVDETEISNDQAVLRYRSGRFTLVNFRSEIQVNSLALGEGDEVVLMTGDRIHLGNTVLIFLERRVVEALRNLHLEILEGVQADLGKSFDLNKERLMIGRGRNCDIRLADPEISRVHCVLVLRNNRFFVQHRSETNPTFVNGISLLPGAERQVVVGDRIQVSSQTVLQFRTRS